MNARYSCPLRVAPFGASLERGVLVVRQWARDQPKGEQRLMKIRARWSLPALLLAAMLGARPAVSQACGIDGIPSLTVNGYLVVINKQVPTGPNLKLWAPFVLSFSLHTGRDEMLQELPQRVPLQPEAFRNPWRWNFGDGTHSVRGITVHHRFSKPGTYKVTVEAYFPSRKYWYTFDALQVRVLRG